MDGAGTGACVCESGGVVAAYVAACVCGLCGDGAEGRGVEEDDCEGIETGDFDEEGGGGKRRG